MTRIHIMGGPGSGKTTLAKNLASHLDIPYTAQAQAAPVKN